MMTTKKLLSALGATTLLLASAINASAMPTSDMLKASYVQMDALGSISSISKSGIQASNIIIFGFANPASASTSSSNLAVMKTITSQEAPNTLNFISIGGQTVTPATLTNPTTAVNNIVAQIKTYNTQLAQPITGVDLDLENGFTAETISALAQGFRNAGFIVSAAPQLYTTGGDIDANNPTNLVLTSGAGQATQNTYGPAIQNGYITYLMAQTYNTGGFHICTAKDTCFAENQVGFFKAAAQALNNAAFIPGDTKVLIGQVSNQGAGGQYTIFNPNATWPLDHKYDQQTILTALEKDIDSMKGQTSFSKIAGVMQWSLNNDYDPMGWQDSGATAGAFSATIFGAQVVPQPYFIVQISNTGAAEQKNASVTLDVDGKYYVFGEMSGSDNVTIPGQANQEWGTAASAKQSPNTVIDSSNLDQIFATGATSFTATVIGNAYNSYKQPISQPSAQTSGQSYTFEAGHAYNIMFNPNTMALQINRVN